MSYLISFFVIHNGPLYISEGIKLVSQLWFLWQKNSWVVGIMCKVFKIVPTKTLFIKIKVTNVCIFSKIAWNSISMFFQCIPPPKTKTALLETKNHQQKSKQNAPYPLATTFLWPTKEPITLQLMTLPPLLPRLLCEILS